MDTDEQHKVNMIKEVRQILCSVFVKDMLPNTSHVYSTDPNEKKMCKQQSAQRKLHNLT